MNHIKRLEIWGFKKFQHIFINFDKSMNILVGENECGKSTILEAINIVVNQLYKNADKCIIKDLINTHNVNLFREDPTVLNLPSIMIEIEFDIDADNRNGRFFFGMNNQKQTEAFGISFICEFDKDFEHELFQEIIEGEIPYEYYKMSWITFQGSTYNVLKKPINLLIIDTSYSEGKSSFNYFNRTLFNTKNSEAKKMKARNCFRNSVDKVLSELDLEDLEENKRFGVNSRKVILDNIISIFHDCIPLENKGKGTESIIKTKIALDKAKSKLDVVLFEEPENHLSSTNLIKMLYEIENQLNNCQIVVTTHNNMIASRLNLNNILWINNDNVQSLREVDKHVAAFFVKADNNNFLQLLLSEKVFLVEGATEYLLLPKLYKQIMNEELSAKKISVISCNGVSYKKYLEIAKNTKKKVSVITDNDKKQSNIDAMNAYNNENDNRHIFMSTDLNEWTWEVCLYNNNRIELDKLIKVYGNSEYKYHGVDYGKQLGKMLNNKVDIAYQIII